MRKKLDSDFYVNALLFRNAIENDDKDLIAFCIEDNKKINKAYTDNHIFNTAVNQFIKESIVLNGGYERLCVKN